MKMILTPLAIAVLATGATAQETRELGAHEHGHSALNIAFDSDQVAIELEAPGADIVGFEYAAETAEDRAAIEDAIAALSRPLALFVMPVAAECTVTEASASLVSDHEDAHGEDHAEEGEHAEGKAHADGEDHTDGARHTEFQAKYLLTCANPDAIDSIDFAFFDTFPNAEEVDVQMISDTGSRGFEVDRDAPTLDLAGQI